MGLTIYYLVTITANLFSDIAISNFQCASTHTPNTHTHTHTHTHT